MSQDITIGSTSQSYLAALLEEYKTLRDECKQITINMFTSLQWGATILGLVIGAGFTVWNRYDFVVLLIFYIIIPILCGMTMFLWIGEAVRFKRAGDYLCIVEQKVGIVLDSFISDSDFKSSIEKIQRKMETNMKMAHSSITMEDPLVWERWLRSMRSTTIERFLSLIYFIRFLFFPIIMSFSLITGIYYTLKHPHLLPYQFNWLKSIMPDSQTGIFYLLTLAITIFVINIFLAVTIVLKLRIKMRPTSREFYFLNRNK